VIYKFAIRKLVTDPASTLCRRRQEELMVSLLNIMQPSAPMLQNPP